MQENEENLAPMMENADPVIKDRLSRLKSGCVLLALDTLKDPNFDSTLVLICVHSKKDGAYGLILNRPTHMPISEVFDGFAELDIRRKLYIGGPVNQNVLQVLQITDAPQKDAFLVSPRIYMGGQWENLESLITSEKPNLRLFLGYSGWSPGQLEYEIMAGAWEVYEVNTEKLLAAEDEQLAAGIEDIKEYLEKLH
jgi:putative transcriptional regulator